MKLRIGRFLSCLFAGCLFLVSASFGQTPADAPQDAGGGNGTTARSKPSATGTGSVSTTYVFPTGRQMTRYWLRNTVGLEAFTSEVFTASWDQWVRDNPKEWTKDAEGWGKRYGASLLDNGINESSLVVLSRFTGQDPRYHRCDCNGLWPRSSHAIKLAIMAYNRNGDVVVSPAKIIAPFTGPMVTRNTIYPDRYGFGDAASSGGYYFAGRVAWNLVREFIWKKAWLKN